MRADGLPARLVILTCGSTPVADLALDLLAGTEYAVDVLEGPRSRVEETYGNLTYVNEVDGNGHVAAREEPGLFATEVQAAFRPWRAPEVPGPRR